LLLIIIIITIVISITTMSYCELVLHRVIMCTLHADAVMLSAGVDARGQKQIELGKKKTSLRNK